MKRLPRNPKLVAFGAASNRFADNPAYAFLACSESRSLRCVWISGSVETIDRLRRLGFEAERRWSPKGVWIAARAGWFVYGWSTGDVNRWLSDGAKTFNLWHGVGVKRIQRMRIVGSGAAVYSAAEGSFRARAFADDRHTPDLVLSTSPSMTTVLAEAFGVARTRCLELGYPRNDHLHRFVPAPAPLADEAILAQLRDHKVIGYFPTFRDDSVSIPGGSPMIRELGEIAGRQGARLLFKAHDASEVQVEAGSSLVVLPPESDLNAYLAHCDVIVTDYSSVASDFLLLRRPIVLFVPDIDHYDANRGFALDPRSHLPGIVMKTAAELYGVLGEASTIAPPSNLDELTEFYWGRRPSTDAGRAVRLVLEADDVQNIPSRS